MAQPVPIEEATERLAEIIESVTKRRERVTITTPDGGEVVVINAEDLEGLEETLAILSDSEEVAALARSTAEAAAGDVVPLEEVAHRPSRG
jgi:antitoxin YefM